MLVTNYYFMFGGMAEEPYPGGWISIAAEYRKQAEDPFFLHFGNQNYSAVLTESQFQRYPSSEICAAPCVCNDMKIVCVDLNGKISLERWNDRVTDRLAALPTPETAEKILELWEEKTRDKNEKLQSKKEQPAGQTH